MNTSRIVHFPLPLLEAAKREAQEARRQVADAYHSLGILGAWAGELAWSLAQDRRVDLASAVSLVATVTRQQAADAVDTVDAADPAGATDAIAWNPAEEWAGLQPEEAADALCHEVRTLAQMLLLSVDLTPVGWEPTLLRTVGCLLMVTAQLRDVLTSEEAGSQELNVLRHERKKDI